MTQTIPDLIPAWVDGRLQQVEKLAVHQRGLRHKAVSVFVMQGDLVLLQRRAIAKYHTPGLWANTCCTHPAWGEAAAECAQRRLWQELGVTGLTLRPAGQVEYRAEVGQGLIEHEVVDVFVARVTQAPDLAPDPAEVAETQWMDMASLMSDLAANPGRYTPWLHIYLDDHRDQIFGT
jgi:isopentenyl-diphosphate Delta-isomerase